MKLRLYSDLHLEFNGWEFHPPVDNNDAEVIVLAGDIHRSAHGIQWAQETFPGQDVIYVMGNHEYYRGDWDASLVHARGIAAGSRVHLLEDDMIVIQGVRFIGATLWTDFALFGAERARDAQRSAEGAMNDFRVIGVGRDTELSKVLTAALTVERHRRSRQFIEQTLALPFNGPTVVVTHHAPGWGSVASRFRRELTSAAFASNLDALIEQTHPELWLHGHTHDSFDYRFGDTRIVCNPRGYPVPGGAENPTFRADILLEIRDAPDGDDAAQAARLSGVSTEDVQLSEL